VTQLASGDTHCATAGASITDAAGNTAYVCNGADGADGKSFDGTFTSPGGEYSISVTDSGIKLSDTAGGSLQMAGGTVKVNGQETTVGANAVLQLSSAGTASVRGGLVQLGNGSCVPVALLGSQVLTPTNPLGQVTTGSATVCAAQ
jgi:hypothetical protein